jgi:hypothetical protein
MTDRYEAWVTSELVNPHDDEGLELWLRYYVETETFDRGVCHRRGLDGTALPASGGEMKIIQEHARTVMKQIGLQGSQYPEEKKYVSRMPYSQQQRMLKMLEEKSKARPRRRTGKELGE